MDIETLLIGIFIGIFIASIVGYLLHVRCVSIMKFEHKKQLFDAWDVAEEEYNRRIKTK